MTVKELIEKLKQYKPNSPVLVMCTGDWGLSDEIEINNCEAEQGEEFVEIAGIPK